MSICLHFDSFCVIWVFWFRAHRVQILGKCLIFARFATRLIEDLDIEDVMTGVFWSQK